MAEILVLYATVDGHSAKIADRISSHAREQGHEVAAANLKSLRRQGSPEVDTVILIAPVHYGRHARRAGLFVRNHRAWLEARSTSFISVSLSAASKDPSSREAAQRIADNFLEKTRWHPDRVLLVAGALSYSKYGFLKRWVLREISRKEEGPTDVSRDHDLTDWPELMFALDEFLGAS